MLRRKQSKHRATKKSDLATFSRANFDAAVADPETDDEELDLEDFTEEDEAEGDAIVEELVLAGDVEALENILALTEEGLLDQIDAGELSQKEAENLYLDEVEYLEELLALVADEQGIPEDELLDDEEDEDYDDELEALAEEEGEEILYELEPEELAQAFNFALDDLEADVAEVEAALESGHITEEEADEYDDLAVEIYEDLVAEYEELLGGYEDEGYYDEDEYYDDPLVDHVESLTQEVAYQRRQNAQLQAEFSSGRVAQDVSDRLDYLERVGDELVQQGIMPPAVFEREFGVWANERDRFAGFSLVCQENGTDPATELEHKERVIQMFADFAEAGAPLYAPGLMSWDEELSDDELSELENIAVQATRNVRHLLGIS